jgi:cytochrome c-type biogenesis protein CcmH
MTGWIALAALVIVAVAALWLMRLRGPLLQLSVAFLLFGCAGYALQGNPGLAGSPREAGPTGPMMPMAPLRHAFFGQFVPEEAWMGMADAFTSQGDTEEAVDVMDQAVHVHPDDYMLWVGLGNALVDHAGVLTPASEYAYRHAAELAPGYPAPLYFFGLALARSGDRDGAIGAWQHILENAPADASWRPIVENSIAVISGGKPNS